MRFVLLLRRIFGGYGASERVSAVHRNSYMGRGVSRIRCPARRDLQDYHGCALCDALIKIDHVGVEHADAPGRNGAADRPGLVGSVNAE
jgi:hypothetical protein